MFFSRKYYGKEGQIYGKKKLNSLKVWRVDHIKIKSIIDGNLHIYCFFSCILEDGDEKRNLFSLTRQIKTHKIGWEIMMILSGQIFLNFRTFSWILCQDIFEELCRRNIIFYSNIFINLLMVIARTVQYKYNL